MIWKRILGIGSWQRGVCTHLWSLGSRHFCVVWIAMDIVPWIVQVTTQLVWFTCEQSSKQCQAISKRSI